MDEGPYLRWTVQSNRQNMSEVERTEELQEGQGRFDMFSLAEKRQEEEVKMSKNSSPPENLEELVSGSSLIWTINHQ